MKIGIGLPSTIPGTTGEQIVEWARRSEQAGFSTLGTLDRLLYENYEPLIALSAAAAVTERIGLATAVLLGPLRPNSLLLAKQALSVHALSDGRLTLGIGLGGRDDDFEASGLEASGRGERLDQSLEVITSAWREKRVGPSASGAPSLIVGGNVDRSFTRAARYGDGWIAGASGPEQFAAMASKAIAAWEAQGREGKPRLIAIAYYALGDRAAENAEADLGHYYAWLGEEIAGMIIAGAAKDPETVTRQIDAYVEAGCDELIFFPTSAEAEQVDLLAAASGV